MANVDQKQFDELAAKFNSLLELVGDHLAHLDQHLRQRGVTPPQDSLRIEEFTGRLAALRVPTSLK